MAFFPHDFPDTPAYARLATELHAEQERLRQLRPKGRFPLGTPHPPNWAALEVSELSKTLAPAASAEHLQQVPGVSMVPMHQEDKQGTGDDQEHMLMYITADEHEMPAAGAFPAKSANADALMRGTAVQPGSPKDMVEVAMLAVSAAVLPAGGAGSDSIMVDCSSSRSELEELTMAAADLPAEGAGAGGPTAMDTGPDAGAERAIAANSANEIEPSAEALEAVPAQAHAAPQLYVVRTLAQLNAALGSQTASTVNTMELAQASKGSDEAGGNSRAGTVPSHVSRQIWHPVERVVHMDPMCLVRVSIHIIGAGSENRLSHVLTHPRLQICLSVLSKMAMSDIHLSSLQVPPLCCQVPCCQILTLIWCSVAQNICKEVSDMYCPGSGWRRRALF